MLDFLLLAQDPTALDPTGIGEKLGQAQDVQEIQGIIIGALIAVVLGGVTWYLRERKAWGEEKVAMVEAHGKAKAKAITAHGAERLAWEVERGKHAGLLTELANENAEGREAMLREQIGLTLKIEKALDRLSEIRQDLRREQS